MIKIFKSCYCMSYSFSVYMFLRFFLGFVCNHIGSPIAVNLLFSAFFLIKNIYFLYSFLSHLSNKQGELEYLIGCFCFYYGYIDPKL